MTDRIKGLTVVLEPNIREDAAEYIINAIKMVKGVVSVGSHVADVDHYIVKEQVRKEMRDRKEVKDLIKALNNN